MKKQKNLTIFNKLHKKLIDSEKLTLEEVVEFLEQEKLKPNNAPMNIPLEKNEYLHPRDTDKELKEKAKYNLRKLQIIGFIHKNQYLNGNSNYEITPFGIESYKFAKIISKYFSN